MHYLEKFYDSEKGLSIKTGYSESPGNLLPRVWDDLRMVLHRKDGFSSSSSSWRMCIELPYQFDNFNNISEYKSHLEAYSISVPIADLIHIIFGYLI